MKAENRYLIAKYADDLQRLEPVNIGVMLWTPTAVGARFLPLEQARSVVNDKATYSRWVNYWTRLIEGDGISIAGKRPVKPTNQRFLDAILKTQKAHYLLYDAGFIAEPVKAGEVENAVQFLFDRLVAKPELAEREHVGKLAREILDSSGVPYKPALDVSCNVYGVEQQLRFDFAVESQERPRALFLKIFPDRQQSVTSGAFKFECIVEKARLLPKEKCIALMLADSQQEKDSAAAIKMLGNLARVVNMRDKDMAVNAVQRAAA